MSLTSASRLRHQQRRAGGIVERVEHDLRLHARDTVDVEPMLPLKILHHAHELLVVVVAGIAVARLAVSGVQRLRSQRTPAPCMPADSARGAATCGRHRIR